MRVVAHGSHTSLLTLTWDLKNDVLAGTLMAQTALERSMATNETRAPRHSALAYNSAQKAGIASTCSSKRKGAHWQSSPYRRESVHQVQPLVRPSIQPTTTQPAFTWACPPRRCRRRHSQQHLSQSRCHTSRAHLLQQQEQEQGQGRLQVLQQRRQQLTSCLLRPWQHSSLQQLQHCCAWHHGHGRGRGSLQWGWSSWRWGKWCCQCLRCCCCCCCLHSLCCSSECPLLLWEGLQLEEVGKGCSLLCPCCAG